jgi:nucleolar protein 56
MPSHLTHSLLGILNDYLKSMLELNLSSSSKSKSKKSSSIVLGVSDKNLASSISSALSISCDTSSRSLELIRGVRLHAEKLLGGAFHTGDMEKAQLGLGHSYSRSKVKFNVNRSDNMIIQAIALLDQLDKDVNTFSMRIREWYGYTFPELAKLVQDHLLFARAAQFIGNKATLDESKLEELTELLEGNEVLAKNVLDAARSSMGTDLNELDALNIHNFAQRVVGLAQYRQKLVSYLSDKMNVVAPSLTALIGERIGARLISHAGSLTNLSKYPASTVQILGAEKALFRALKTKGNTPKVNCYPLIHVRHLVDGGFPSVRPHLPLYFHWASRRQAQRSHFSIPGQQVLDRFPSRLLLWYVCPYGILFVFVTNHQCHNLR